MSTEVDIYNLALANIGQKATVASLTELSVERQRCTQFYASCLRKVLAAHAWSFATKRETLAEVTNDTEAWDYKYALPNLYIHALAVLESDSLDWHDSFAFVVEGSYLYTNVDAADLRFVWYQDNPGHFPAWFEEALACLLASRIAGPIIKGAMGRQERNDQYKAYLVALGQAKELDSNQSKNNPVFVPSGIAARGGMSIHSFDDLISEQRSRRLR